MSGQKPDAGSGSGPGPDHPGADLPPPDPSKPGEPKPDQPKPDQPKPDQPQQPDPAKPDPDPTTPTDPDPKPPAPVPAAPLLSLAVDTGSSDHDRITSSGSVNVSGLEAGATLAFSLDGGKTWTAHGGDALLPDSLFGTDGEKHLTVRQIDASGNEGVAAELSFVLDRTAPDALHWTMPADRPALGAADRIVPLGAEAGALVEYRLATTAAWQTAVDGQIPMSMFHQDGIAHLAVRQTDLAGNVGPVTTLTVNLDATVPHAPTLALQNDTGVSSTDGITSSGNVVVGGLEPGARLLVSTNGGDWDEWAAGTGVVNVDAQFPYGGQPTVQVKQVDAAGNASVAAALTFTLDQEALIPNWTSSSRHQQTGGAAPDQVSLNAQDDFTISLHSLGARHQDSLAYRVDGGAWRDAPADGHLPLSTFGADGKHLLELRETDLAGNEGLRKVEVTLDATPPVAPTLALFHDDGPSATDHVTTDGRVVISGPDLLGLDFQSRLNGGGWVDERLGDNSPRNYPSVGETDLEVRFIDAAGNVGPSSHLHYTVGDPDTTPSPSPGSAKIQIPNDPAISSLWNTAYTQSGTILVFNASNGEYRWDDGAWNALGDGTIRKEQLPGEGLHTLSIRTQDAAGHPALTQRQFTIDDTKPEAPHLALIHDTGASDTDLLTSDPSLRVTGLEPGATWVFSGGFDHIFHYGSGDTISKADLHLPSEDYAGLVRVTVQQIDQAGNLSDYGRIDLQLRPDGAVI
ncbi:hypothetical protein ACQ859_01060 [Roseateles chitinivorans]|uniref:hypothetical protein n=1 Tax=Roseateles chitinivorans TaxID=2917965 RepID=UPI003D66911E